MYLAYILFTVNFSHHIKVIQVSIPYVRKSDALQLIEKDTISMNDRFFSLIFSYPGDFFLLQNGVNGGSVHAKNSEVHKPGYYISRKIILSVLLIFI